MPTCQEGAQWGPNSAYTVLRHVSSVPSQACPKCLLWPRQQRALQGANQSGSCRPTHLLLIQPQRCQRGAEVHGAPPSHTHPAASGTGFGGRHTVGAVAAAAIPAGLQRRQCLNTCGPTCAAPRPAPAASAVSGVRRSRSPAPPHQSCGPGLALLPSEESTSPDRRQHTRRRARMSEG